MDVHIDVIHKIELYDQLVEIFHDMQLMNMHQMLFDFFHPDFILNKYLLNKYEQKLTAQ
jgi:hypothetical protein